jgi:AcrR family transcriptional regulator
MIEEAALELFALKGYRSSSVREISGKIGVKESALYFHFENKQAILDSLIDRFESISGQMMLLLAESIAGVMSIDDSQFLAITERYLESYFMDAFISRCIMVMNHERSHNEQLRLLYAYWCLEKPLEFQTQVIQRLQEIGYLKETDAAGAALSYYAPIFLHFNQYINSGFTAGSKEAFKKAVDIATRHFLDIYKSEPGGIK